MDVEPIGSARDDTRVVPTVAIPELRDYHLINAEVVALLEAGHRHIRLAGAENQRLLLSGLTGDWDALLEVEGRVGPEFAAGLRAPNLTVLCQGSAADGLCQGMEAGVVCVLGDAGAAVGQGLRGGTLTVSGNVGPRAGLNQRGGFLILLGDVGRLAGDRQAGGRLFLFKARCGPYLGHGGRGGELIASGLDGLPFDGIPAEPSRKLLHIREALPQHFSGGGT